MIKSELVQRISAQNPHLYQRDVENIVNAILGEIIAAMARGDRVELRGFGAFSVKQRPARTGRNPRTGAHVAVDQKCVPFFKTGKEMRERLNRPRPQVDRASRDRLAIVLRKIVAAVILVPLAIVIIAFAVANRQIVTVSLDPFSSEHAGRLADAAAVRADHRAADRRRIDRRRRGLAAAGKWRRTARRLEREMRELRGELAALERQRRVAGASVPRAPPSRRNALRLRPPVRMTQSSRQDKARAGM